MPLKLAAAIVKDYTLDKSDAYYGVSEDRTKVTIRQANQGDNERRTDLFSEVKRVQEKGVVSTLQRWSYDELRRLEVYLTLVDCNILDENGESLFKFRKLQDGGQVLDMKESAFTAQWKKLPPMVAEEIHSKVLDLNVTWSGAEGEED